MHGSLAATWPDPVSYVENRAPEQIQITSKRTCIPRKLSMLKIGARMQHHCQCVTHRYSAYNFLQRAHGQQQHAPGGSDQCSLHKPVLPIHDIPHFVVQRRHRPLDHQPAVRLRVLLPHDHLSSLYNRALRLHTPTIAVNSRSIPTSRYKLELFLVGLAKYAANPVRSKYTHSQYRYIHLREW